MLGMLNLGRCGRDRSGNSGTTAASKQCQGREACHFKNESEIVNKLSIVDFKSGMVLDNKFCDIFRTISSVGMK